MGVNCSLPRNVESETSFAEVDSDISSESFENSDGSKNLTRRHLSTLTLKKLLSWSGESMSTTSSETESLDEKSCDSKDGHNESLEQLWEDCFDLTELIERTQRRVMEYMKDLTQLGHSSSAEQSCIKLISRIASGLEHVDLNQVVHDLESGLFSTDGPKSKNISLESYSEVIKQVGVGLSGRMNETFDLFLASVRTKREKLIQDAFRLWVRMFKIYTDLKAIDRKCSNLLLTDREYSNPTACGDDQWKILSNLLHFVMKMQRVSPERAHNLLVKVADLRMVFNGDSWKMILN